MNRTLLAAVAVAPLLLPLSAPASAAQDDGAFRAQGSASSAANLSAEAQALKDLVRDSAFQNDVTGAFGGDVYNAIEGAYAANDYAPIWSGRAIEELRRYVTDLGDNGIAATRDAQRTFGEITTARRDARDAKTVAAADLDLTLAYTDLVGQVGSDLSSLAQSSGQDSLQNVLRSAADGQVGTEADGLDPQTPQYAALKKVLKRYRQLEADGGWQTVSLDGAVEEGETNPQIPALRRRLAVEGFFRGDPQAGGDTYDAQTVSALKAFQSAHGITEDGVIGPQTMAAVNESVSSKIGKIEDSMKRWRALGDPGDKYIWANIPSYTASGWSGDREEVAMRAIFGKESRETPTFSDKVDHIVANPKWYVPSSILRRDKLPKLKRDPGYADRGNYTVVSRATGEAVSPFNVNWHAADVASNYRLVQGSGPGNALGEMKIIFPNQYSVYLHDTPSQSLFDNAQRAFSSGCVRLDQPKKMAEWVAEADGSATAGQVDQAIAGKELEKVQLNDQVGVHITYMTVTTDDRGNPVFWRDVYDRVDGEADPVRFDAPFVEMSRVEKAGNGAG